MILTFLNKYRHAGLLMIRIGLGIMFMFHGAPKMFGGPERWAKLGMATGNFGIDFFPALWGFMAAFSEFFGGILLILGLFFRPACILLAITMIVAAGYHIGKGDGLLGASHAIENGIVLLSLILIGPGKISLDERLSRDRGAEI